MLIEIMQIFGTDFSNSVKMSNNAKDRKIYLKTYKRLKSHHNLVNYSTLSPSEFPALLIN